MALHCFAVANPPLVLREFAVSKNANQGRSHAAVANAETTPQPQQPNRNEATQNKKTQKQKTRNKQREPKQSQQNKTRATKTTKTVKFDFCTVNQTQ